MVETWRLITRRKPDNDNLRSLSSMFRCSDEQGLDDLQIAAAAVFHMAMKELNDVSHFDSAKNMENVTFFKEVAKTCRDMKYFRFLGGVHEYIGSLHPCINFEVRAALENSADFFDKVAEAFERSDRGVRWDHRDDQRSKYKRNASIPSGVIDPRSAPVIRARLSAFIDAVDKLYDKPRLTAPLATISSRILGIDVDKKQIENCRRLLNGHRGPNSNQRS